MSAVRCYATLSVIGLVLMVTACHHKSNCLGKPCFSLDDCCGEQICFYGYCRQKGQIGFETVYASLTPPAVSSYVTQQCGPIQLADGRETLTLQPTETLSGSVVTDTGQNLTGEMTATGHGLIPTLVMTSRAAVTFTGFTLPLVWGTVYQVSYTPDDPTQPPVAWLNGSTPDWTLSTNSTENLTYLASDLVQVSGTLTLDGQNPAPGAQISATSTDANNNVLTSTTVLTDPSGAFTLFFPPVPTTFTVTVRPGPVPNSVPNPALVPKTVFANLVGTPLASPHGAISLPSQSLGLGQSTTMTTRVTVTAIDTGAPVEGAAVLFSGSVGAGTFSASGVTLIDGTATFLLLSGTYSTTVAPPLATSPYGLLTVPPTLRSTTAETGATLLVPLTVSTKIQVSGQLYAYDGSMVPNATVSFSLLDQAVARQYSATTTKNGSYSIEVDPGMSANPLTYEVTVDPGQSVELPRYRELLQVSGSDVTHDIHLFAPTLAYGRVIGSDGVPVSGVTVSFFSNELTPDDPTNFVLVGLAQTSSLGEFVVPLPTPEQP